MKLERLYEAGAVRRYHAKRCHGSGQTIADHSWGVCLVLMYLYFPDLPSAKQFQHAVMHDVAELITGDVPAPAKWRSPELRTALAMLETEVHQELGVPVLEYDPVLKWADNAELVMYCLAQVRMGNQYFLTTAGKGLAVLRSTPLPTLGLDNQARDLFNILHEEFESCSSNR